MKSILTVLFASCLFLCWQIVSYAAVFSPTYDKPPIILSENFEGVLDPRISVSDIGGDINYGIKSGELLGSTKVFGFGRSSCPANCFANHVVRMMINFATPLYISTISFKEIELYGNWGSEGKIFLDGEPYLLPEKESYEIFGRLPVNDLMNDSISRDHTLLINKTVSNIEIQVWDITNTSEIILDNLTIFGYDECNYYDHTVPCILPGSSTIVLDSVMGNAAGMIGYFVGACYEATEWSQDGDTYVDLHVLENPIPEGIPEGCAYYHASKSYLWINSNYVFGGFGGTNFLKDPGFFWRAYSKLQIATAPPPTATYGGFTQISPSGSAAEPVNTATGNYYYQHTDLAIAGRGLPLAFARTYNAQDGYSGPLGRGWTHSYHIRLTENADGSIAIKQGDGHEEFYDPDGNGGYRSRYAGLYSRLAKHPDNSYTLTTKERTAYAFAADGKLISIADKNGNTLAFSYDGAGDLTTITDTAGRTVTLTVDAEHRITRLTDPLDRTVQFAYDGEGHLVSDTDAMGGVQTYSYDASHRLTQIVDRRGHVLVGNTYDDENRVVSQVNGRGFTTTFAYNAPNAGDTTITDALGHATVHTHDSLRRLIRESDPLGHSSQYVYDDSNNRTQVTDKNGNVTQYTYDARGNVTGKTDALSHATAITYDGFDNPTQRIDALGGVTAFAYDDKGNLTQTTDALGHVTQFSYNAHGQPLTSTDTRGGVTTYAYDDQGNLVKMTDALGGETLYSYDAAGRRTASTDANGAVTAFAYDANDRLIGRTDALGSETLFSYDANGNRTGTTDALGRVTALAYDENDLPVSITDALGGVTAYGYDAADNRTAETDPRGNVTRFGYDAANRRTSVTDALNNVTTMAYDAQGNLTGTTNPLGHGAGFAYDALNRRTSATDGLGHTALTTYDALGRIIQNTDANGHATRYSFDALGRLTQSIDALGGTVDYAYDAAGNRTAMTDTNGNTTAYVYDALNRLLKETDPLGNADEYEYDTAGNTVRRTDTLNRTTRYSYDANRRLTTVQYPDASTVGFAYDAAGNRTAMTDNVGQTRYSYDALNRLTQHVDPFGKAVGYAYDAAGNLTTLTYPGDKAVTYGYDALNRMQSVADWLGGLAGYRYDAAGNLAAADNPNGTQAAYAYDDGERLIQLAHSKPDDSILASYNLTLDAAGNRTAVDQSEPLAAVLAADAKVYDYDPANRVTAENGHSLSHDANGNLSGKDGIGFTFDFDDRLTGNGSTTYRYDGLGHRLETQRLTATTRYVHDLSHALPQLLMETDATGNPLAYYVYGLGLLSRIAPNDSVRYYHYDPLGNTVALTDSNGAVTDSYAYDPFGQVLAMQQSTDNPFRYVGQFGVMAEDNGLNYMRARYYSPGLGRFISKDPLTGTPGDSQSLNRYAYGLNNPVRYSDASGLIGNELKPGHYERANICIVLCITAKAGTSYSGTTYDQVEIEFGLGLGISYFAGVSSEEPVEGGNFKAKGKAQIPGGSLEVTTDGEVSTSVTLAGMGTKYPGKESYAEIGYNVAISASIGSFTKTKIKKLNQPSFKPLVPEIEEITSLHSQQAADKK